MAPILLVTRPVLTATTFEQAVRAGVDRPFESLFSPLLEILPVPVGQIEPSENLIITSSNGAQRAAELGIKVPGTAWCVGRQTTERAKRLGLPAEYAGDNAGQLLETISQLSTNESYLHLSGTHTRGEIVETLQRKGFVANRLVVYDQKRLSLTEEAVESLKGTLPVVLPLFSPRTADLLRDYSVAAPLKVIAISAAVEDAVPGEISAEIECVERPNEAHMVEATVKALTGLD